MTLDLAIIAQALDLLAIQIGPFPVWQIVALSIASAAAVEVVKMGARAVEVGGSCAPHLRPLAGAGVLLRAWRRSAVYASTLRAVAALVGATLALGLWGVGVEALVVGLGAGAAAEVVYRYLIKPAERIAGKETP
jgi:hypothetical protein